MQEICEAENVNDVPWRDIRRHVEEPVEVPPLTVVVLEKPRQHRNEKTLQTSEKVGTGITEYVISYLQL